MKKILILAAALIGLTATVACGALITPQVGGGIGSFDGGISSGTAVVTPPSSCDGTLDLSKGCATPLPGSF